MHKNTKAIETRYKGYRFRTRLEARWAVFFDALGVRWEYEKEGFELSTGDLYLPDFWLPDDKLWVEVKGEQPDDRYHGMLSDFSEDMNCAVLLVVGIPWENQACLFARDSTDCGAGCYDNKRVDIFAVDKGRLQLMTDKDSRVDRDRVVYADFWESILDIGYMPDPIILPIVGMAIDVAKSARFELGETL
ncbi:MULTISPECIES: hypothetical protein [Desulfosporosinus]|uniref:Uncharacterized protein n=1 Tax=Desulfosporosinus lacus DSM 15449 TaxID=1121420 RepID=A0A1M5QIV2_9FIRM|nr:MULTISPECIES: hypothetical protein [Desulfosporosinus]SHH14052.1 hypothetical protein SAMN02746098_00277 [Desulfosporosinus lacus DSM 15449]